MKLPEFVIEWCCSHKGCAGCKIACVAPNRKDEFDAWIQIQIEAVKKEVNTAKPLQ